MLFSIPPQTQRRRHYRARRNPAATTTTTMSGLTVSNNNPSSSSSLSSTPIFPTFSLNPSTGSGFLTKSSSSTSPSLFGSASAASSSLQSSNSSAAAPPPAPLFGTSSPFASLCAFSSGSADDRVSSSSPKISSPKISSPPILSGSVKMSAGSETPVHEKSVIEEEKEKEEEENSSSSASPNQKADAIPQIESFDGIALAADKISILLRIQRQHPSCISSLRLRSKSHRRTAYEHLLQVIQDLKAIGCDGDSNSYAELGISIVDLEFYGFDMRWFRVIVGEFEKNAERRREVGKEKEDKRKAREELVKQIEAIDAELAAATKEVPPPVSLETLSALFE